MRQQYPGDEPGVPQGALAGLGGGLLVMLAHAVFRHVFGTPDRLPKVTLSVPRFRQHSQGRMSGWQGSQSKEVSISISNASLPTLEEWGFTGGHAGLRAFCAKAFSGGAPRFLRVHRNGEAMLAIFRHADLRTFGSLPALENVPPGIMFGTDVAEEALAGGDGPGTSVANVISNQLFTANAPIHRPLRMALLKIVGPKPTAELESRARAIAEDLLAPHRGGGEFDFARAVAGPLAARYFGSMIGLTAEETVEVSEAIRAMAPLLNIDRSPEETAQLHSGAGAYRRLIEGAAMRSLGAGGCPHVTALAEELAAMPPCMDVHRSGVVPANAGLFIVGNFFDAFHTAAVAVANAVVVLADWFEVLDRGRNDANFLERAVAEALRLEPPLIGLSRYVFEEMRHGDVILPANSKIFLMWGAANRDPAAYPEPDSFNPQRSTRSVTFGGGEHICPGRFAGAMLARAVIATLLDMRVWPEVHGSRIAWRGNSLANQPEHMPVTLSKRAG